MTKHITLSKLQKMKQQGEKIAMLTCYDAAFAKTLSEAGVDILLVGDTLGMVVAGYSTTIPVTVKDITYHTRNVCRANPTAFVIADMPFMSYSTTDKALSNATKLMQAGGEMVKMEGGAWLLPTVRQLTERGIPTCVHLGLTPQSVHAFGGYKVQGRIETQAQQILEAALQLEQAGAQLLVLECIPYELTKKITQSLSIPVIGIGAGPYCDGQVLVTPDMLGITGEQYTFTQNFLEGQTQGIQGAIKEYVRCVKSGEFPSLKQSFT